MYKSIYLVLLFLTNLIYSQNNPINWSTSVIDNGNNEYTLVTKGVIKDGWRLYAQTLPEGGALPTEFVFENESPFSFYVIQKYFLHTVLNLSMKSVKKLKMIQTNYYTLALHYLTKI